MTRVLELPDALAAQIDEEARQLNIEPEQWAILKLQRTAADGAGAGGVNDDDWEVLSHGLVSDNRELLERLAK